MSSTIPTHNYSNTTITSTSASSGSGLIYAAGTGITADSTWSVANGSTHGTMSARDVILDGVSLKQLLEERLNLMVPNPELEKEWDQLKALGDEYRRLEADLKEKAKIWKALNKV